jgi:iron-sulfur cluster assembly accessory protein
MIYLHCSLYLLARVLLLGTMAITQEVYMAFPVTVTEEAHSKASALLRREQREDLRLRLAVQPGGCSGLIYQLFFDERLLEGDLVETFGELEVVVDEMSAPYLAGSIVSFSDSLDKQGFSIDNPNAAGTCACGDSFH